MRLPMAVNASAVSANVPPSPLLSARRRISTYFNVTTISSDQKISDKTPNTAAWVTTPCSPPEAKMASRSA